MGQNLDFPVEILIHIGLYLNRHQLITCGLVCKTWNIVFSVELWSTLEFSSGKPITQLCPEYFCERASAYTSSLEFNDSDSTTRFFSIAKHFTRLQSLTVITTLLGSYKKEYWKAYEQLTREIPSTLESITLKGLVLPRLEFKNGNYGWSPLLNISRHPQLNLTTLRLENCELSVQYMDAFWDICERVKVLHLCLVPFELPKPIKIGKRTKGPALHRQQRILRFPNLLDLSLDRSSPKDLLSQLELIICQAPNLQSLNWAVGEENWFPYIRIAYLLTGQEQFNRPLPPHLRHRHDPLASYAAPCWPYLKSLALSGFGDNSILDRAFVKNTRGFQRLRIYFYTPVNLDSLMQFHSSTLTRIDGESINNGITIQKILSSCPNLTKVHFRSIPAQSLVEQGESWVCCDHLEELKVYIDIDPKRWFPSRKDATDQEIQDLSWKVFKSLARLHKLRVYGTDSVVKIKTFGGVGTSRRPKYEPGRHKLDDPKLELAEYNQWEDLGVESWRNIQCLELRPSNFIK
ncbi:hypothetical protein BGZ46_004608 [Entomortierella lignicola]|nr:hypothetical protein BGZ46_004608 [Entomortierella lignicola]